MCPPKFAIECVATLQNIFHEGRAYHDLSMWDGVGSFSFTFNVHA
eukprot:UN34127